jgi:rare lipoprotein A (peptidoglycan hydrolase)
MKGIVGALILAAFALVGCSTVREAPKSPDKLCSGTKRPYQVKGVWYTPQEHYQYEEEGVASWYGPRFHGRPKSCGEIFNMHGISAAHKTLPIPCVVEVTNVKNGSAVKLLVDDRGPFVDDRIIDLSKGAAVYLGIHNQGLGTVRVKCLPDESKAFAKFVSQYGRYGRDPDGKTWETIFRQNFDNGCSVEPQTLEPQTLTFEKPYRAPRQEKWSKLQPMRQNKVYQRADIKPIPVSRRGQAEKEIDKEIDDLLEDTRKYLRRRQA